MAVGQDERKRLSQHRSYTTPASSYHFPNKVDAIRNHTTTTTNAHACSSKVRNPDTAPRANYQADEPHGEVLPASALIVLGRLEGAALGSDWLLGSWDSEDEPEAISLPRRFGESTLIFSFSSDEESETRPSHGGCVAAPRVVFFSPRVLLAAAEKSRVVCPRRASLNLVTCWKLSHFRWAKAAAKAWAKSSHASSHILIGHNSLLIGQFSISQFSISQLHR